jgi:hypothetical protein
MISRFFHIQMEGRHVATYVFLWLQEMDSVIVKSQRRTIHHSDFSSSKELLSTNGTKANITMSFRTVGSASSSSQAERIRPSEINGCVVQQVSYLEEIDDEYVLEALERLRGRSLAVPVGAFMTTSQQGRPPLVPKQPLPKKEMQKARVANQRIGDNSTNSSTISPLTVTTSNKVGSGSVSSGIIKGSHRSFDSKTKQKEVPEASPVTPDSSVASSVSGGHQNEMQAIIEEIDMVLAGQVLVRHSLWKPPTAQRSRNRHRSERGYCGTTKALDFTWSVESTSSKALWWRICGQ